MNIKNVNIEKIEGCFSKKNSDAVLFFMEKAPFTFKKNVEVAVRVKVYSQDIYFEGKHTDTRYFYVLAVSPDKSVSRIDFNFNFQVRLKGKLRAFSNRYEFRASAVTSSGIFFIRLYKFSVSKFDLSPPDFYQSKLLDSSSDFL